MGQEQKTPRFTLVGVADAVAAQSSPSRDTVASLRTVTVTASRSQTNIPTTPLAITKVTAPSLRPWQRLAVRLAAAVRVEGVELPVGGSDVDDAVVHDRRRVAPAPADGTHRPTSVQTLKRSQISPNSIFEWRQNFACFLRLACFLAFTIPRHAPGLCRIRMPCHDHFFLTTFSAPG